MPRLAEFHAAYPDIDLRIKTSLRPPNFKGDDIDVAVVISEKNPSGLIGISLFKRVFSPVCSPDLLSRYPGASPLDVLQKERLLLSDMHMDMWTRWIELLGLSTCKHPRSRVAVADRHPADCESLAVDSRAGCEPLRIPSPFPA